MSQASQNTLDAMKKHFGGEDHRDWETSAYDHLRPKYSMKGGMWEIPGTAYVNMPDKDTAALKYLIEEWDHDVKWV